METTGFMEQEASTVAMTMTAVGTMETLPDPKTVIRNPYWYPGIYFYPVHIVAIVSLSISIIASVGVIIYHLYNNGKRFWTRPKGERMAVYLAICDILFSVCHLIDHATVLGLKWYPPQPICMTLGYFTVTFILCQQLIILYMSINAFLSVGLRKKVDLGKYDWKLFAFAFGGPILLNTIGAGFQIFGPGSIWCLVDLTQKHGMVIGQAYSLYTVVNFIVCGILYIIVWIRLTCRTNVSTQDDKKGVTKFINTAKMMSICVLAAMFQWTPGFIQTIWRFWSIPHPFFVMATVFNTNVGGLLNCFAYTFIKKYYSSTSSAYPNHNSDPTPALNRKKDKSLTTSIITNSTTSQKGGSRDSDRMSTVEKGMVNVMSLSLDQVKIATVGEEESIIRHDTQKTEEYVE